MSGECLGGGGVGERVCESIRVEFRWECLACVGETMRSDLRVSGSSWEK